jgi:hypothetical protein
MSRKPLALAAQVPELSQLDPGERRPTTEEERHPLITIVPRVSELVVVEQREVPGKARDHASAASSRRHAPAPNGAFAGFLPSSSPNQFRIFRDKLCVTCMSTSLPPPSAQWPGGQRGKRGFGPPMVAVRDGPTRRRARKDHRPREPRKTTYRLAIDCETAAARRAPGQGHAAWQAAWVLVEHPRRSPCGTGTCSERERSVEPYDLTTPSTTVRLTFLRPQPTIAPKARPWVRVVL